MIFSKSVKNPYTKKLKKQLKIHIEKVQSSSKSILKEKNRGQKYG